MNYIFIFLLFFSKHSFSSQVNDNSFKIAANDLSIENVTVVSNSIIKNECQSSNESKCFPAILKVKLDLVGCLDRMVGYSMNVISKDPQGLVYEIYFQAIKAKNKNSDKAACPRRNFKIIEIPLEVFGEFQFINSKFIF